MRRSRYSTAKIILVVGVITFVAAIVYDIYVLRIILYNASTGVETYWSNVVMVLLIVALVGASPIAVSLLLFRIGRGGRPTPDVAVYDAPSATDRIQ